MQVSDFPRFSAVMTGMAELYQRELSGPLLDAYWLSLRDWQLAEFESAAAQLMRTSEFMPRPVAFLELRKAGRPTAGEAWAAILQYAHFEYSPNFPARINGSHGLLSDPLVDRAVNAIGGYRAVAMAPTESKQFLEKRFCEHFEAIQESSDIREAVPQIAYSRPRNLQGPMGIKGLLGRLGESDS